jgi:outer membrane protein OmpA-like peptidoglycan-associated protein
LGEPVQREEDMSSAKRLKTASWLAGGLFLAACATEQPSAPSAPPPPKPVPAPAHAVSHGPARSAAVKSAGPLKYAMVGGYMDAQEKDFRTRLRGATVMRVGDDLILSLRNDALFSGNSLSPRGSATIGRLAELLRHYDHSAVQVQGFTDTAEAPARAQELTQNRAKQVADALVADGVGSDRVSAQGYGSAHLRVATGPQKTEPRNRRIEIRVTAHPEA